jgi:N-methylhydantoinase A
VHRIATDIGGTFTDIVWIDEESGEIRSDKSSTTPDNVVSGVLDAYRKTRLDSSSVSMFVHGSTVATNALVTRRGATTGLITTQGFRDSLEIRRINRPDEDIYNVFWIKPPVLIPRHRRVEISARMRFNGEELRPVVKSEVVQTIEQLKQFAVDTVAVCLLHAYADPRHELEVRSIIQEIWPDAWISLSHEVAPEIREYERVSSTAIDAFVKKPVVGYLRRLERSLNEECGIAAAPLIANSAGGVSTIDAIAKAPIQMIESGPAGGAIGAAFLSSAIGVPNLVTADVGGTSYDVSLVVEGKNQLRSEHDILGYAAKVSSIDVRSVGAGGGSIARVDAGGRLYVGPESAGAFPGPMCYAKGGNEPTVTDAAIVTGLIDPARFAGGEIQIDPSLSHQGVERLAQQLSLTPEATAEGILTVARNNMANVTNQILVGEGYDPRDFSILAFGGGGGLFASEVARTLDIPSVIVPPFPSVFSAWGMLSADIVGSFARSYVRQLTRVDVETISRLYEDMVTDAKALMADGGIPFEQVRFERSADTRYEGQGHEVEIPLDGIATDDKFSANLGPRFHRLHAQRYGHEMPADPETVTFRLRAFGSIKKVDLAAIERPETNTTGALKSERDLFVHGSWRTCSIFDRDGLKPGDEIDGPALIEEPTHITVLMPGDKAEFDDYGCVRITVGS